MPRFSAGSVARPIETVLDCLMLVTTDGRKVVISAPIAPAQVARLREAITRCSARAQGCVGQEHNAASFLHRPSR